ncbi:MAG: hypothetical protein A2Z47_01100 [Thermodesulfovibrio sp. RBG_19FT_COMBO_42_12]|nr:MAG: hypothetical protein A2Z47_01100 [Thermodesulfovibrio sp. RBG_19FT_COMBO_42_12]
MFNGQPLDNGDVVRIMNACELIYLQEGRDPATIPSDDKAYICVKDAALIDPLDPVDTGGYVGMCWKNTADKWQVLPPDTVDACIRRELTDFCRGIQIGEVVDPSEGSVSTDEAWNIPAFLADASIKSQLGDPIRTYQARIVSAAPEGLLQEFSELIRFGIMTFNNYGSLTECVIPDSHITYTCNEPTNKDAGKVIHHIESKCSVSGNACTTGADCPAGEECFSPVGDHSSGLINTVDGITAQTWTPFAEAFYNAIGYFANRVDVRINPDDFDATKDPVQYICQRNNVLIVTDGMSTADLHADVIQEVVTNNYNDGDGEVDAVAPACLKYAGSRNVDDLAWLAKNRSIQDFTQLPTATGRDSQTITTHVVFSGLPTSETGECNPETLMQETAENGGGTYQRAENPDDLYSDLRNSFLGIAEKAASGTAASVLASGEGQGAVLVQAVFYPIAQKVGFGGIFEKEISWLGRVANYWYYVDPFFVTSNMREDTVQDDVLDLADDYIAQFYYDQSAGQTKATLCRDDAGDGDCDTPQPTVSFENLKSMWEAGIELWKRDLTTTPRTIYVPNSVTGGAGASGLDNFSTGNASSIRPYLDLPIVDLDLDGFADGDLNRSGGNPDDTDASILIRYIHGEDFPAYTWMRSRTTAVDLNGDGDTVDSGEGEKVWRLGDVLNSTPRVSSGIQLNTYDSKYSDTTYSSFVKSSDYINRGMVFAGGNDGMLHAFKLGKLEMKWGGQGSAEKAKLTGTNLGKEIWAFIPKNVIPYLKYIKETDYCHIFSVDLTPYIFDATIGAPGSGDISDSTKDVSAWRTIVIVGMRFGGACRGTSTACADVSGDASKDCVNTPVDVGGSSVGYSTYFALDITDTVANPDDPANHPPVLLWEFSNPQLGFTTTGPAVVRIGDATKNGKWFAVFGSGPTGPVSTTDLQFMGRSDQSLKLFVLDLKTGALASGYPKDTGIQYAFAGSMLNSTLDADMDYQDDAVYIGYVKRAGTSPNYTWTDGGVGRIFTKEDPVPDNWVWRTLRDNIGPVTSSVTRLQSDKYHIIWLYFGTGRYYFEQFADIDDPNGQRKIFGIKEPCFTSENTLDPDQTGDCQSTVDGLPGGLTDVTSIDDIPTEEVANSESFEGWYINLDCSPYVSGCTSPSGNFAERVITDPVATSTGLAFFATYKPYDDVCAYGGKTYLWAVRYNTGGAPSVSILKGVALLQVSTGSIEQIDLSTAFVEMGGRRTSAMEGVPPTSTGLALMSSPPPVKKVLHIRER